MVAAKIGKTLLNAYNSEKETKLSAKEFFHSVFFPLFFDHEKYLQWVTNSPFVQGIKKGVYPTKEERKTKLEQLNKKISENEPDASIAIGFPSTDLIATTSGLITNIKISFSEEEVYCSWIGGGLGIGVQGAVSIYFDNPTILMHLFEGWAYYRNEFLNQAQFLGNNK